MSLALFNDKAHPILAELLDEAEERLVREGVCELEQANEWLAARYVAVCGEFLEHAAVYLESEERIGADLFLFELAKDTTKRRFARNAKACAIQLATHTTIYFPNYLKVLRLLYLHALRTTETLDELARSGVLRLAVGTLPGVLADVRSELRRRGAKFEPLLVPDDKLPQAQSPYAMLKFVEAQKKMLE